MKPVLPAGTVISYLGINAVVIEDGPTEFLVSCEGNEESWWWDCAGHTCEIVAYPSGSNHQPASTVHGEPVAYMAYNADGFPEKCRPDDPQGFPVYAAPQPTEQQTEQQPVAEVKYGGYASGNELVWAKGAGLQFLPEGTKLYAASIHAPTPVAYLDVGAGGYMDLGTDLTEDQVGSLPWGRHILAIVGTYGADGYVPAEQQPDVTQLVEALEAIERMNFDDHSLTNAVLVARKALATYRKGGEA